MYRVGKVAVFYYLDAVDVARMLGVSRQRIGELVSAGDFNSPKIDRDGCRVWLRDMIERWAAARSEQARDGQRLQLPVFGPLAADAERVWDLAAREARGLNHHWIGNEHLLLALLDPDCPGAAPRVLESLGFAADHVREVFVESMGDLFDPPERELKINAAGRLSLLRANFEAAQLQDEHISSEHVLLAIAEECWFLTERGLDREQVRRRVLAVSEGSVPASKLWATDASKRSESPWHPPWAGEEPELAPSPIGHDPRRRRPWGSAPFSKQDGHGTFMHGKAMLQYRIDRDGYPVLTTDGRPIGSLIDPQGEYVLNAEGKVQLTVIDVPQGAAIRTYPREGT